MQAAILIEKLAIFPDEIEKRNAIAARYSEGLRNYVRATPTVIDGGISTWAQYTIEHDARDALAAHLKADAIPTRDLLSQAAAPTDGLSRVPQWL